MPKKKVDLPSQQNRGWGGVISFEVGVSAWVVRVGFNRALFIIMMLTPSSIFYSVSESVPFCAWVVGLVLAIPCYFANSYESSISRVLSTRETFWE